MATAKDPLRQLIDLAVFAPIGLLTVAQRELPNLIASGRARVDNQVTLARFVGKLVINKGRQELQRRLDAAEQARHGSGADVPKDDADDVVLPLGLPETIIEAVATELPGNAEAEHEAAAPVSAVDLPVDGYDSLAASQVVLRLPSLTADELDVILQHELTHRARRTILGKISQLQAG